MFCRKLRVVAVICIGTLLYVPSAFSSDYGCKLLLCLMNPGGATEFQECEPTIRKFKRDMYLGRSFPKCDMGSDGAGVEVVQAKQMFQPCAESYGEGFVPFDPPRDRDSESSSDAYTPLAMDNAANYEDGHAYNANTVCRKYLGTQPVRYCQENDDGREILDTCYYRDQPIYDTQPVISNTNARYVQTYVDGEAQGQKFHYEKKKKKRSW